LLEGFDFILKAFNFSQDTQEEKDYRTRFIRAFAFAFEKLTDGK